jgi:hypothetical protein
MMRRFIGVFVCFLCFQNLVLSQITAPSKVIKPVFKKGTYYIRKDPLAKQPIGIMVMLPGLTDAVYSPFFQSKLADTLSEKGYIIMVPILSDDNMYFALKNIDMQNLKLMLADILTSLKSSGETPIILGGFSIGGTIAMRFHQKYWRSYPALGFHITHLYAIDPPLDLVRLYSSFKRMNAVDLLTNMQESFPGKNLLKSRLIDFSPLKKADNKEPIFEATKLRMYCEPDINWYLEHKMQVNDMNIVDCSAFYQLLKENRRNKVQLILTQGKGFRPPDNIKHPHSWSIIDPDDFISWTKQ